MEHEDAARGECLINLSNFLAVARWSRIKDRQMNRSVGGGKKEEGGNAGVRSSASARGRRYPAAHESVIAAHGGPCARFARTRWRELL